jgi:hypothetical protein
MQGKGQGKRPPTKAALLAGLIARFFAFEGHRTHYIFSGQGSQLFLGLDVADILSVPLALVGLISEINRAFGHGVVLD